MNANPNEFGRLLATILDRRVDVWFEGDRLHWGAVEDEVDTELPRLLRRYKTPLRQALGPDTLPEVTP
jgi:hypothetical protein